MNYAVQIRIIMLSIERCREILTSKDYMLDTEEIKQLRDFLYQIATYQIETECGSNNYNLENNVA